jgi:hypothetical protein
MNDQYTRFWQFVKLRQNAYWKHEQNGNPPYSDDPVIGQYRFCNVYREIDRGTKWFQMNRPQDGPELLWASLIYRQFNKIATFTTFGRLPKYHDKKIFLRYVLKMKTAGVTVFTGRHQCIGLSKVIKMSDWLTSIRLNNLYKNVINANNLPNIIAILRKIPGVGRFFSWQIICDLMESNELSSSIMSQADEWVYLGPGAIAGCRLIDVETNYLETAKMLRDSQPTDDSLIPPPEALGRFSLKNIEHALCEYARYVRASDTNKSIRLERYNR